MIFFSKILQEIILRGLLDVVQVSDAFGVVLVPPENSWSALFNLESLFRARIHVNVLVDACFFDHSRGQDVLEVIGSHVSFFVAAKQYVILLVEGQGLDSHPDFFFGVYILEPEIDSKAKEGAYS